MIELDEMKGYLRVDYSEDDALITQLISSAESLCMDVARIADADDFWSRPISKIAVMYAVAFLYEHREEADHHELALTLRAMLFGIREGDFF